MILWFCETALKNWNAARLQHKSKYGVCFLLLTYLFIFKKEKEKEKERKTEKSQYNDFPWSK